MNFHPNEISLILIDYKGGGMANAFIGLPHLAGTITNLGGNKTNRALRSIKAEIKRRQTLFNEFNVNHIDSYSRYFRDGTASEPMPHLIIISDEFAELKKEQPEFIKELVSTARVGRSLGVHLILATQKPSGVVDDEIWSNSRFKICLRVQDKQDSNEMLHRPDAALLTNIGRAYMQIGNDEIFELFQSGYSGASYEPDDASASDGTATMIDLDGSQMIFSRKKVSSNENIPTQLSAAVDFIQTSVKTMNIADARQLWLPELEEGITLAQIKANYPVYEEKGVCALIGLLDDPSKQLQYGATINVSEMGNMLIAGSPGSGKSTLLQSLLYSLVTSYPPEEINFYVADFSGSSSRVFSEAPHCGAVVGANEDERIHRLLMLINDMIKERGQLFEKAQVGSYDEFRMASKEVLPAVLLIIDNLFAFNERYPELVDEQLLAISHICTKFGIHLLISVNHLNDVKYKLRQNFTSVLPLQLTERGDYYDALGIMPEFMPDSRKGCGLWGKEMIEFQGALAVEGENEQLRTENIRAGFTIYAEYTGFRAKAVNSIPKDQLFDGFISAHGNQDALCIGYNKENISPVAYALDQVYCFGASASNNKGSENIMRNLTDYAQYLNGNCHVVALKHSPPAEGSVYRNGDEMFNLLVLLKEEFTRRSAVRKSGEFKPEEIFPAIREKFGLLFVFIDSMEEFLSTIYQDREESYSTLVELFFKQGKGLGCYFIARFEPSVYSTGIYREAYKLFTGHGTGIHVGGQLDKQKLIDIPFLTREHTQKLDISQGVALWEDQHINTFVPKNQKED